MGAEAVVNGRRSVVLESPAATLVVDLGGGSIVDFHIAGGGLNPLRWLGPGDEKQAFRPMAHFLCLDRGGAPSEAERGNGMFFHGEASRVEWKEYEAPEHQGGGKSAAMGAMLPMAGLEIRRAILLSATAPIFRVSDNWTAFIRLNSLKERATSLAI